jgi:ribosomal protein S18 acetylase RimI-like enzyme
MKNEKPEYVIRPAQREGDHELLMIMARSAVDEAQGPYATRRLGSDLPPSVFDGEVCVFVAETVSDSRIVGFVATRFTATPDTATSYAVRLAHVTMLGVSSELRRHGIARDLVQRVLDTAKAWKATLIKLEVEEHNQAAIRLYESMGWQAADRMMIFPPESGKA